MSRSHRVTIRLSDDEFRRVEEFRCQDGSDISSVFRRALDTFLPSRSDQTPSSGSPKRQSPPEAIFSIMGPYLAWAGGDLRKHRDKLYLELLACSFACKKLYPRSKGVLEGYEGLLQLRLYFEVE